MARWEFVANANCGTGAGGFKRGNTCASSKSGKTRLPSPVSDARAIKQAIIKDPTDQLNYDALADLYEEHGGPAKEVRQARAKLQELARAIADDAESITIGNMIYGDATDEELEPYGERFSDLEDTGRQRDQTLETIHVLGDLLGRDVVQAAIDHYTRVSAYRDMIDHRMPYLWGDK